MGFNQLSDAEMERLAILSEELAEVMEVLVFCEKGGLDAVGMCSDDPSSSNAELLVKEVGDLLVLDEYFLINGDLTTDRTDDEEILSMCRDERGFANVWTELIKLRCLALQKNVGKTLRHGFESYNPFDRERVTNRMNISKQFDGVLRSFKMVSSLGLLDWQACEDRKLVKLGKIVKYLHEQEFHPDFSVFSDKHVARP